MPTTYIFDREPKPSSSLAHLPKTKRGKYLDRDFRCKTGVRAGKYERALKAAKFEFTHEVKPLAEVPHLFKKRYTLHKGDELVHIFEFTY